MKELLFYIFILILPFGIGRIIAQSQKPIAKKILKLKKYAIYNDLTINNLLGNIIAVSGFIIICIRFFGVGNIIFWFASAMGILVSYILHIADVTGVTIGDSISFLIGDSNQKNIKIPFRYDFFSIIISLILTGIIASKFLAPFILIDISQTQSPEIITDVFVQEDTKEDITDDLRDYMNR